MKEQSNKILFINSILKSQREGTLLLKVTCLKELKEGKFDKYVNKVGGHKLLWISDKYIHLIKSENRI